MKEATLTAEYIIIGLVFIINLLFIGLVLFGIHDLKILNTFKNNVEIGIILLIAIAYYFGGLTSKLATLYDKPLFYKLIIKIIPFLKYAQSKSYDINKKRSFVCQYGSDYLTSLIEKEDKFLILFKCISILLFSLSFILSLWLFLGCYGVLISIVSFITLLLVSYLSFRAHKNQVRIYWDTILLCFDILHEEKLKE